MRRARRLWSTIHGLMQCTSSAAGDGQHCGPADSHCPSQGLECQVSSELAGSALRQLSNPLVRDCCATVAATAGALVLVKLAEILTYKGIIDQVPPTIIPLVRSYRAPSCGKTSLVTHYRAIFVIDDWHTLRPSVGAEAEQEARTYLRWSRLCPVLAPIQVKLCSVSCPVLSGTLSLGYPAS